jgi:hypothetical protein
MKNRAVHNISFDCSFCHGGSTPGPGGPVNTALPQSGLSGSVGAGYGYGQAGAQYQPRGYPQSHESIPATLPVSVTSGITHHHHVQSLYQNQSLPSSLSYGRPQHQQAAQVYGHHLTQHHPHLGLSQQASARQLNQHSQQHLTQHQQQILYGSTNSGTRNINIGQQYNSNVLGTAHQPGSAGFGQGQGLGLHNPNFQLPHVGQGLPQTLSQPLSYHHHQGKANGQFHQYSQSQQQMSEDDFLAKYLASSLQFQQKPSDSGLGLHSGSELDEATRLRYPQI